MGRGTSQPQGRDQGARTRRRSARACRSLTRSARRRASDLPLIRPETSSSGDQGATERAKSRFLTRTANA